jgi:glycosyltransferase involved in cell wall biosynthesis
VLIASPRARKRPILVHTYHGHSLHGYFAPRTTAVYRAIEHALARVTDRLIAVSDEVRDELVALEVAPASKFRVVTLGFDLTPFTGSRAGGSRLRSELGIPDTALVVTLIARLVPIKRVDRFLRIAAAIGDLPNVRILIIGDGELRESLMESSDARQLDDRLIWAGFRGDIPAVCFASDVIVQTSDNEGTPVSLIEAQAAGVPVISTRVGGTPTVVVDGETGWLVEPDDVDGFARKLSALLSDPDSRARMGAAGQRRALERFGLERLLERLDRVYSELLAANGGRHSTPSLPSVNAA